MATVEVGTKTVTVPDEFIERSMKAYGITRDDAIEMFLDDEGITVNEEVKEMTAKAKAAGPVETGARGGGKKRKPPTRKPDMMKRTIVSAIDCAIREMNFVDEKDKSRVAENIEVTNIERQIAFEVAGEKYELTLVKKRKPKE